MQDFAILRETLPSRSINQGLCNPLPFVEFNRDFTH
jgi:hypothetical protein